MPPHARRGLVRKGGRRAFVHKRRLTEVHRASNKENIRLLYCFSHCFALNPHRPQLAILEVRPFLANGAIIIIIIGIFLRFDCGGDCGKWGLTTNQEVGRLRWKWSRRKALAGDSHAGQMNFQHRSLARHLGTFFGLNTRFHTCRPFSAGGEGTAGGRTRRHSPTAVVSLVLSPRGRRARERGKAAPRGAIRPSTPASYYEVSFRVANAI